jgi:hypothetical protein
MEDLGFTQIITIVDLDLQKGLSAACQKFDPRCPAIDDG